MDKEVGADKETLDSMTVWFQKDKPTQTMSWTWNREGWRPMGANAMSTAKNDGDD